MARIVKTDIPQNASKLQRALTQTDARRIVQIDNPIADLWNPHKCPIELLPHLARALSVDVWDDTWPEQVKRDVVAASPDVHRFKGTRYAVETALSALRISTDIVEWWEAEPVARRGTFEITAFVNAKIHDDENLLSEKIQNQALAMIKAAKPKSRVFDFRLGASGKTKLGIGSAFTALNVQRETIEAGRNTSFAAGVGAGNAFAALGIQRETIEAGRHRQIKSQIGVGSAFSGQQIMYVNFKMEAA